VELPGDAAAVRFPGLSEVDDDDRRGVEEPEGLAVLEQEVPRVLEGLEVRLLLDPDHPMEHLESTLAATSWKT